MRRRSAGGRAIARLAAPDTDAPAPGMGRRHFLQALAGVALAAAGLAGCRRAPDCVDEAALSAGAVTMRQALHYADDADRSSRGDTGRCGGCVFFQARSDDGCGRCSILNGPVAATGRCDSFSAKPPVPA